MNLPDNLPGNADAISSPRPVAGNGAAVASTWRQITTLAQKTWLRVCVLIIATVVAHLPGLHGDLIWDDTYLVAENPFFRSPIFSLEVFRHHLFIDSSSTHYRPVQNLSYMVDYLVWNGDVYGYHLSNILWHALAGVLLFVLLRRLFASLLAKEMHAPLLEAGAFLAALIWVLHPVHSAAVDYISGRADSLAFVFCCGAWLTYLRAAASGHRLLRAAGYVAAALLFLLGLCSREVAAVWAAIFVFHQIFFERKSTARHRFLAIAACIVVLGAYAGLRTLPGPRQIKPAGSGWGAAARTGLVLRALGDYSRLTVWPTNLHMERSVLAERMFRPGDDWRDQLAFDRVAATGLLAALALVAGACVRGRGRKLRAFGALWFTAGFLPISNIVDLNATAAEHWMYVPLGGLLLVLAGWLVELPARAVRVAAVCGFVAAMALGVRSSIRSGDWLNAQVFYERTIAAGGWSPRVALNLAVIYGDQGRLDEARALLLRTLAVWPRYPQAQSYLATILSKQGAADQATTLMTKAAAPPDSRERREYPRSWVAALQFADHHIDAGRDDEAIEVLRVARTVDPKVWHLAQKEAEILRRTRGPEAALELVETFAARNWWHYRAHLSLGKLKMQQGDVEAARAALQHASRLDVRETEALNLITRMELGVHNFAGAYAVQRRAVSRQPNEPSQYVLFSEVLMQMGREDEARRARETAKNLELHLRASA